jgi:hypothetical protein
MRAVPTSSKKTACSLNGTLLLVPAEDPLDSVADSAAVTVNTSGLPSVTVAPRSEIQTGSPAVGSVPASVLSAHVSALPATVQSR